MLNYIYGTVGLSFLGYIGYRFFDERWIAINKKFDENIAIGLPVETAYNDAISDVFVRFIKSFKFNDRVGSYKNVEGYVKKARAFADSVDVNLWYIFACLSAAISIVICADNIIGSDIINLDLTRLCMLSTICAATTGEVINNIRGSKAP